MEAEINNYSWTETSFTTNEGRPILIRIQKVRFKCKRCNKTFTPKIKGIERYAQISKQVETLIVREFYKQKSFSVIARDYNLSVSQIIKLFDKSFPYVPRSKLPEVLCIDEIGFKTEEGSYAAILYDHNKREVIDVITNRQLDYLRSYFIGCSFKERSNVKIFISDLYEGYATIKEEFFRDAIHIADMFHIIRLLKIEISKLRVETYKNFTDEDDIERTFMKNHWDVFEQCLTNKLAKKPYYSKKENWEYTTWDMMNRCLSLNQIFWDAYECLQDFYEYWKCKDFDQAILWIKKIVNQLKRTENENLIRVADTYWKWRVEIANAFTVKNELGKRYTNGPAEGLNNAIKTIVKDANGYKNASRFRKRILLILRKEKTPH